jgi:hypothetical protein
MVILDAAEVTKDPGSCDDGSSSSVLDPNLDRALRGRPLATTSRLTGSSQGTLRIRMWYR